MSPSSRRAWIEISSAILLVARLRVALLAEGVDRNPSMVVVYNRKKAVALLAEGVDRNKGDLNRYLENWVALLAEGVDRNSRTLD